MNKNGITAVSTETTPVLAKDPYKPEINMKIADAKKSFRRADLSTAHNSNSCKTDKCRL